MRVKNKQFNSLIIFLTLIFCIILSGCAEHSGILLEAEPEAAEQSSEGSDTSLGSTGTAEEQVSADFLQEGSEAEDASCFVHICGAVVNPGVYELPRGSRVFEAVRAAGGFAEGACEDFVNQAVPVEDGMKINIPTQAEAEAARQSGQTTDITAGQDTPAAEADGLMNLNTATKEMLMTLPGVGAAKAESIIAYRELHGDFKAIEEIMKVDGIKEGLFEKIKDKVKI